MAAVENATDDGTLDAFSSQADNDSDPEECDCEDLGDFPLAVREDGTKRTTD